jgi:digeranylgeranylglycerophospholipid reductase
LEQKPDIVVIGGGPCGSYAAYTAAKLGAKVTVCEEHETTGAPNHCAGHLNISSLKHMGIQVPQIAIENEIRGAIFHSPSCRKFILKRRTPVTYVVDRILFDRYLARLALKAGVNYSFKSRVKSLSYDSKFVKGVTIEREQKRILAKVVVDAEGCSSALLKKTGLKGLERSMVVRGIQAEVEGAEDLDQEMVEVYFGEKIAPGFFAWIIPRKDGSSKVGLATRLGDSRDYLKWFIEKHPVASKKLKKGKIIRTSLHPIPLSGPLPKTYANGFLAVGDAASQVKPTTGGGVIFGLTCARAAGEVAYEAVKRHDYSNNFLSRYQSQWKKLVGFDLAAMLRMRRMLDSLSDQKIDRIIECCNRFGIDNILERFGDVDFQGRSLIPMVKHPGALAVIGYFVLSWLTSSTNKWSSHGSVLEGEIDT